MLMKKVFPMLIVAIVATALGLSAQETTKRPPARPGASKSTLAVKAAVTVPAARGDDEKPWKTRLLTLLRRRAT